MDDFANDEDRIHGPVDSLFLEQPPPGGLFITNIEGATNESELSRCGITHVLSLLPEFYFREEILMETLPEAERPEPEYSVIRHNINMYDLPHTLTSDILKQAFAFIDSALEGGGRCCVHCHAGQSRSGAILLAYCKYRNARAVILDTSCGVSDVHQPEEGKSDTVTMQEYSFEELLSMVRKYRPCVQPNTGFWREMRMMEKNGMITELARRLCN